MPKVAVDIWSDVMCPWCAVGYTQFAKAVEALEGRDRGRSPLDAVRAQSGPAARGQGPGASTSPKSTAARPRRSPRCARRCRRPPRAPAFRWTTPARASEPPAMMWNTFEAHKLLRWALAEPGARGADPPQARAAQGALPAAPQRRRPRGPARHRRGRRLRPRQGRRGARRRSARHRRPRRGAARPPGRDQLGPELRRRRQVPDPGRPRAGGLRQHAAPGRRAGAERP